MAKPEAVEPFGVRGVAAESGGQVVALASGDGDAWELIASSTMREGGWSTPPSSSLWADVGRIRAVASSATRSA